MHQVGDQLGLNLYEVEYLVVQPFKDEVQTVLFKDPVRTAL